MGVSETSWNVLGCGQPQEKWLDVADPQMPKVKTGTIIPLESRLLQLGVTSAKYQILVILLINIYAQPWLP
jgi:hypothetical protein